MPFGDLQAELNNYLQEYPESMFVNEAAGDYYNDLLLRYGDKLEFSYEDLYGFISSYYLKSYEQGNESLKVISEICENSLYLGKFEQGVKFYHMAVSLEPYSPSYNYNLGFALSRLGEKKIYSEYIPEDHGILSHIDNLIEGL